MAQPRHLTIIVLLAFVQGFMVTLVALIWFGIASLFSPDSGITSPLLVMVAEAEGGFLVVLALLYLVFAAGAWRMRDWAWWIGLLASVLNVLYMVHVLLRGEPIVVAVLGLIIPLTIIWYLLSPMGRQVFARESGLSSPLQ